MIEIRTGGHREILKPGRKTDRRIDPQTEPKLAGQLPKSSNPFSWQDFG